MEFQFGGLIFTSKFDSGNLANVEKVCKDEEPSISGGSAAPLTSPSVPSLVDTRPDYEFNVWTKPDCSDTPYVNGNRSWFYFGVRGGQAGKVIRINIMNMNRQTRLYSQGHVPLVRTVPGRPRWERIKDRPTYETVNGNFILTFIFRFFESRASVSYFAFAYPWSYETCQEKLKELDVKFGDAAKLIPKDNKFSIYYHRELLCHSLGNLRVDLITVSDCHGMQDAEEPRFDDKLFPDQACKRCKTFTGKKVYFLSSRVHPGETPGSFVFNGFLDFVLREDDPRAKQLRKQYVFKLIPMLNPDGVSQGHYRTDTRGVNLNRVYLDPCFELYPSIYAAKSLLVYHHVWNSEIPMDEKEHIASTLRRELDRVATRKNVDPSPSDAVEVHSSNEASSNSNRHGNIIIMAEVPESEVSYAKSMFEVEYNSNTTKGLSGLNSSSSQVSVEPESFKLFATVVDSSSDITAEKSCHLESSDISNLTSSSVTADILNEQNDMLVNSDNSEVTPYVMSKDTQLQSSLQSSIEINDVPSGGECEDFDDDVCLGNEGSDEEDDDKTLMISDIITTPHLSHAVLLSISPLASGIAFYVDLHGHASKRGCFIYGNCFDKEEMQVESMVFAKLISLNSAHFDFGGCNFTEKNMYMVDKKDGSSKEGSGRVAAFKALGINHSYTLECNYNTGRIVNTVPPASGDEGRASPPPLAGFPPRYTPAHYEDVGKAIAIAALDFTESNPWSRLPCSEFLSLYGLKDHLRKYLQSLRAPAKSLLNKATKPGGKSPSQSIGGLPRVALLAKHPVNISSQSQNCENVNMNMSTNSNAQLKNIPKTESKKFPVAVKKPELASSRQTGSSQQRRVNNFRSVPLVTPLATSSASLPVSLVLPDSVMKRQPPKCEGISLLPLSAPARSWNTSLASKNLFKRQNLGRIDSKISSASVLSRRLASQSTACDQSQLSKSLLSSELMFTPTRSADSGTIQKSFCYLSLIGGAPEIASDSLHGPISSDSINSNSIFGKSFLQKWQPPITNSSLTDQVPGTNLCEATSGTPHQQSMMKEILEPRTVADNKALVNESMTASAISLPTKTLNEKLETNNRVSVPITRATLQNKTDIKATSVALCFPTASAVKVNSLLKSSVHSGSSSGRNRIPKQSQPVARVSGNTVPVSSGSGHSSNESRKVKGKKNTSVKKKS